MTKPSEISKACKICTNRIDKLSNVKNEKWFDHRILRAPCVEGCCKLCRRSDCSGEVERRMDVLSRAIPREHVSTAGPGIWAKQAKKIGTSLMTDLWVGISMNLEASAGCALLRFVSYSLSRDSCGRRRNHDVRECVRLRHVRVLIPEKSSFPTIDQPCNQLYSR